MKFFITLLFTWPFLVIAQDGNSTELEAKGLKPYPYKSGEILYEITGDASGESKLTFSKWGWREKSESKYSFSKYGIVSSEEKVEMRNGDYLYQANLKTKEGSKKQDQTLSDLLGYKENDEAWEATLTAKGGEKNGNEEILGLVCDIWIFPKGIIRKAWIHKGLVLKSEKQIGSLQIITTAIASDFDLATEEKAFLLPDINWKE